MTEASSSRGFFDLLDRTRSVPVHRSFAVRAVGIPEPPFESAPANDQSWGRASCLALRHGQLSLGERDCFLLQVTARDAHHDTNAETKLALEELSAVNGRIYPSVVVPRQSTSRYRPRKPTELTLSSSQSPSPASESWWWRRCLRSLAAHERVPMLLRNLAEALEDRVLACWQPAAVDSGRLAGVAPRCAAVRAMAWHPRRALLAVCTDDDVVRLLDVDGGRWLPASLSHAMQRNVYCMQWRRQGPETLAVGCELGVCVWTLHHACSPTTTATTATTASSGSSGAYSSGIGGGGPVNAWMSYLHADGHSPVTSLAWQPSNGALLASGSPSSSTLVVWDVAAGVPTPLHRVGGRVTQLAWSPNGHYLFCATDSRLFRVFETLGWTCQRWGHLPSAVRSAVWHANSRLLVFALVDSPYLYSVVFLQTPPALSAEVVRVDSLEPYTVASSLCFHVHVEPISDEDTSENTDERRQREEAAVREFFRRCYQAADDDCNLTQLRPGHWKAYCPPLLASLAATAGQSPCAQRDLPEHGCRVALTGHVAYSVGGNIRQLAWDQHGERLAVTFDSACQQSGELIALFATSVSPDLEFNPLGYLRGPPDGRQPLDIQFRHNQSKGSLLTCAWLSGQISFFPLLFRSD